MSPPDPSINHNTARDAHHEGSAKWFIHGDTFQRWKTETGSLLWVHGKRALILFLSSLLELSACFTAGSGKSILSCVSLHLVSFCKLLTYPPSSSIIEDITNHARRDWDLMPSILTLRTSQRRMLAARSLHSLYNSPPRPMLTLKSSLPCTRNTMLGPSNLATMR